MEHQGDREQWKVTRAPGEHAGWLVWVGWAVGVLWSKFELAQFCSGRMYRVCLYLPLKGVKLAAV